MEAISIGHLRTVYSDEEDDSGFFRPFSTDHNKYHQKILEHQAEERRRIGHELQEELGQMLAGVAMVSFSLADELRCRGSECAGMAEELSKFVQEAHQFTHNLTRRVCPVELHEEGLVAALDRFCGQIERRYDLDCVLECEGAVQISNHMVSTILFQIARKGALQVAKYDRATWAAFALDTKDGKINLSLETDGVRTDEEKEKLQAELQVFGHQVNILGGLLSLEQRSSDATTTIRCTISHD